MGNLSIIYNNKTIQEDKFISYSQSGYRYENINIMGRSHSY